MAAINIFMTSPTEERLSVLKEYAKTVGCVTLPYGICPAGLEAFPQAVLLTGNDVPADLMQKHPAATAVFSYTPVSCKLPNILCDHQGQYICLCMTPPDNRHFVPPGLTEDWITTVQKALRDRDPETVTVELCAGAYAVPFPYDGHYHTLTVSEALALAHRHGAVLSMNKNSYYSYFIHSFEGRPRVVFLSTPQHFRRLVEHFIRLGIKRFAVSDAEILDKEMKTVLSFFKNLP